MRRVSLRAEVLRHHGLVPEVEGSRTAARAAARNASNPPITELMKTFIAFGGCGHGLLTFPFTVSRGFHGQARRAL